VDNELSEREFLPSRPVPENEEEAVLIREMSDPTRFINMSPTEVAEKSARLQYLQSRRAKRTQVPTVDELDYTRSKKAPPVQGQRDPHAEELKAKFERMYRHG
jgi:hypothetical protein